MIFPFYVDKFNAAWSSATRGIKTNLKSLPGRHELRAIVVEFATTIKQAASGPATTFKIKPNDNSASGGANDLLTIAQGFLNRLYLRRDKQTAAYNVSAIQAQMLYGGQHLEDMFQEQVRDGDAIPANGGTAIAVRIKFVISFLHEAFEVPNLLCGGTEQASLDGGWEVGYDAGTIASLTSFAIANGNILMTTPDVSVHCDLAPTSWPIVGPTWFAKEDQFTTSRDEVAGPVLLLLTYDPRLPLTMETNVQYCNVRHNGQDRAVQQTPSQMAGAWLRSQGALDGIRPLDLSRSVTPIDFCASAVRLEERELPFVADGDTRVYTQQLAAGGSAAATLVRHFVVPLEKNDDSIKRVMAAQGYQGDWRHFPVRFKGRDAALEMFKAREIRPT